MQYRHKGKSPRQSLRGVLFLSIVWEKAKATLGAAAAGDDPIGTERKNAREAKNTLESVAREYLERHNRKLRSIERQKRDWERLALPKLGTLEITRLLDANEDKNGLHSADLIFRFISRLFSWHATPDENFRTPLVRGMGRVAAGEGERDCVLSHDELRALWRGTEDAAGRPDPTQGSCC